MRAAVVAIALLSACHIAAPGAGGQCPTRQDGGFGDEIEGTPCAVDHDCFVLDEFSPCLSSWYRCVDGQFHRDRGIGAMDGAPCADSPIASCSYEGNPSCDAEPTSQFCSCGADGTWSCLCLCYGPTADCGACPLHFDPALEQIACGPIGNTCTFVDHRCDCVDDGSGTSGRFHCM